jgi:hypothetical protein
VNAIADGDCDDTADADWVGMPGGALAVDADVAGVNQGLRKGAASGQPYAVEKTVDPQGLALEAGKRGERVAGGLARRLGAAAPASAPTPGITGAGEADLGHQPGDGGVA